MKFVHFADSHLDGYRDEKLNKLSLDNLNYVIDFGIEKNVDFFLMAGDLFNTALPKIETLKETVSIFKNLKEKEIPVYFIPGSHDFSPNGKTMLDILEKAGFMINVFKGKITPDNSLMLEWTIDSKTKTHITGIIGKKGMLDKNYYGKLDYNNLVSDQFKIFMFHTAIKEMIPKELEMMDSFSVKTLPPGFDYYAGGHVHIRAQKDREQNAETESQSSDHSKWKNPVVFPGPTFPNSFSELEKLRKGSFVFYENNKYQIKEIPSKEVVAIHIDCENKTSDDINEKIEKEIIKGNFKDKIVLIRFFGKLKEGKVGDIDFRLINRNFLDEGAYIVLQNTNKLKSKEFVEMEISEESSEDIEKNTIFEHLGQINLPEDCDERELIQNLIKILDTEQYDGESKTNFTERLIEETKKTLESKDSVSQKKS